MLEINLEFFLSLIYFLLLEGMPRIYIPYNTENFGIREIVEPGNIFS